MAKSLRVLLAALFFVSVQLAQDSPKPALIEESGTINCESFRASVGYLFEELGKDPASIGHLILHDSTKYPLRSMYFLSDVHGLMQYWSFPKDRIVILKGPAQDEPRYQFFKFPAGASALGYPLADWKLVRPLTKTTEFSRDEGGLCGGNYESDFFKVLENNPDLRGKIVIRAESSDKFKKKRDEIRLKHSNVSKDRMKFLFRKSDGTWIEKLWLIPRKK